MSRRLAVSIVILAAVGLLGPSPGAAAAQAPTQAQWADEFVDSVGVNVHMGYNDTPYKLTSTVADRLETLGVRHVRDGVMQGRQDQFRALNALAARGIRSTLIMGDPAGRYASLDRTLPDLHNNLLGAAEAVESTNEYDNWSGDPNWAENLRDFQRRLYASIKDDPRTAHLPVLAPSFVHRSSYDAFGDMTPYLDAGNLHPYPGGERPERPGHIEGELSRAAKVSGVEPVIATETGYHNATATTSGHKPVSETAAASYVQRLLLTNFRRGIPRSFLYELLDQFSDPARTNPERNFGLLRDDLSPKPAFTALSNLLHLLDDPGHPVTAAGSLTYSWSGATTGLQDQLMRKGDGSFWLVAWRDDSLYDTAARENVAGSTNELDLELPEGRWSTQVFRPSAGRERVAHAEGAARVPVTVGPDPVVLRIADEPEPPGDERPAEQPLWPTFPPQLQPFQPAPQAQPPRPPPYRLTPPAEVPVRRPDAPPAADQPVDSRPRGAARSVRLVATRMIRRLRRPGRQRLATERRIAVRVPVEPAGRVRVTVSARAGRLSSTTRDILVGRTTARSGQEAVMRLSRPARRLLRSRRVIRVSVRVERLAAGARPTTVRRVVSIRR